MKDCYSEKARNTGLMQVWTTDGLELWSSARALIRLTVLRANPAYIQILRSAFYEDQKYSYYGSQLLLYLGIQISLTILRTCPRNQRPSRYLLRPQRIFSSIKTYTSSVKLLLNAILFSNTVFKSEFLSSDISQEVPFPQRFVVRWPKWVLAARTVLLVKPSWSSIQRWYLASKLEYCSNIMKTR